MKQAFDNICVVGLGYVGLPTAAILADRGFNVLGVDTDPGTVALINQGLVHIVEPDLDVMVKGAVAAQRLRAAGEPEPSDAFIIAVPTPFTEGHKPDLGHLRKAAAGVAPVLARGNLVVVESTTPVGTTEAFSGWLAAARPDLTFPHDAGDEADVKVAHSPERVLPGRVLKELVGNDRVIGGVSRACGEAAAALYRRFVNGECVIAGARATELVKLAENSYRDVNIAFANEMSLICDRLDLDVWEVVRLANRHPRVDILKPGPGVGGHCIAVDPWFIVDGAPEETALIQAARQVNDATPHHVVERILAAAAAKGLAAPRIACLGLAYKADIDDLRESPAVRIVKELAQRTDATLAVVEPHIERLPEDLEGLPRVGLATLEEALEGADMVVLLVDHRAFRDIERGVLEGKTVVDTRGVWG